MEILILGGTVFVGRGIAEAALERGHKVTLFHRGSKGTDLIPGADEILGDRDGGLEALDGRTWDAVVDACGYVPRVVAASAQALRSQANRYLFISTISVYEPDDADGLRVRPVTEPVGTEEITGATYGALKVECEREVTKVWGDRSTMVRPGLVAGPYDPTGRFPYWVGRCVEGGPYLVPDKLDLPIQQIDARDLGEFVVKLLEQDASGVFDAVGESMSFRTALGHCEALNRDARSVIVDVETLKTQGIEPSEFPLVSMLGSKAFMTIEPTAALEAGLERRPLAQTTKDTADWLQRESNTSPSPNYLSRDQELKVLSELA